MDSVRLRMKSEERNDLCRRDYKAIRSKVREVSGHYIHHGSKWPERWNYHDIDEEEEEEGEGGDRWSDKLRPLLTLEPPSAQFVMGKGRGMTGQIR